MLDASLAVRFTSILELGSRPVLSAVAGDTRCTAWPHTNCAWVLRVQGGRTCLMQDSPRCRWPMQVERTRFMLNSPR